ncbi:MAG: phospholipid/cholesterol/gamma-HCH transport system substrate-binding protein [Solirubrobacterales bacterium]|jgi:ABC-type transporter Mla subunit MlaD|nr:phospholipid/cholesterol/gamma-HCH transport system substrate-binding protein [Solirubrobacterales bacterium]
MRNRSGIQGVASSPVIVGAVTVLVVMVAVFLAYNANNGLPFVSTYNLKARVPNANALVKGNEVRIGGARVGVVKSVVPVQEAGGKVSAELSLSLDKNVEPLPANSTMIIRPKSPLGLKYLQIVPGDSKQGFAAGETIPAKAARPEPVDIDQFFDMFDERTRKAIQRNLAGFGNALAGRGPQINNAFVALRMLAESSEPTLADLVAPSTGFGEFWRALEALSATVAPVAEEQASMFAALDRTFAAFARVSRPFIQETISKGPETLDTVTADLPALRPFLRDSGRFFTALRPGARVLSETSPTIAAALRAGIPALNRSPSLNAQLPPTADALLAFQQSTGVFNGLDLLIDTNNVLAPAIRFIAPAQTTCNYLSIAFRNLANASGEDNGLGSWLNVIAFQPPEGVNSEAGPASAPANGGEPPGANKGIPLNHLHSSPYPNTAAPGQPKECEAGNERYESEVGVTRIGNTPRNDGIKTAEQSDKQLGKKEK